MYTKMFRFMFYVSCLFFTKKNTSFLQEREREILFRRDSGDPIVVQNLIKNIENYKLQWKKKKETWRRSLGSQVMYRPQNIHSQLN